MKRIVFIVLYGFYALISAAASVQEADSAYTRGNYSRAAELYAEAQKEKPSAELLYNMGNCYYRMDRKAEAVLYYRRALKMDSSLEDARFNLELVVSRLEDRFDEKEEMFFVSALRDLAGRHNARGWAWSGFCWMVFAVASFLVYRFAERILVRKAGLTLVVVLAVVSLACDGFAVYRRVVDSMRQVVVMRQTDVWRSAEMTGERIRTLHEGAVLQVVNSFGRGLLRVEMPDGTVGFVEKKNVGDV